MRLVALHQIAGREIIAPGQAFDASQAEAEYLLERGAAVAETDAAPSETNQPISETDQAPAADRVPSPGRRRRN